MKAPTWLLILVGVLLAANIYTINGTLMDSTNNAAPELPFAPPLRIVLAALWVILFTLALLGLLREKPIALSAIAPLLTLYGIVGLAWNLVFAQSSYSRGSRGFDILVSLIVLAPVWWLALRRGWIKITFPLRGTD